MAVGAFFVILACFCWGLIFVVPNFLPEFGAIPIALGRFFFFGLFSVIWLISRKRYLLTRKYKPIWIRGFWFGIISTIFCYSCLIYCIRFTNTAVAALIYGMAPVTIALAGNIQQKSYSFRALVLPLLLISVGVLFVNVSVFDSRNVASQWYAVGLLIGLAGLASWTWYTLSNARFMQENPTLSTLDWTIILGAATFVDTTILCLLLILPMYSTYIHHFFYSDAILRFLLGSLLLGVVSSWLSFYFWNLGNTRLPISLAGQLTVFEMIFGLLFFYLIGNHFPQPLEVAGIIFMIMGVLMAFAKVNAKTRMTFTAD